MSKCCICNEEKKENLVILGKSICTDCEWKILTANVHKAGYAKCISGLKTVLNAE